MLRSGLLGFVSSLALCCFLGQVASAQSLRPEPDSDQDGLSDALEQRLLDQFSPKFHIGKGDCSGMPAAFTPGLRVPSPMAEDGTIYGQVFPIRGSDSAHLAIEVHFYHLWAKDCGGHSHPLDTEHVAVLLQGSGGYSASSTWRATYWYAAAHENTVCDVSQIARASTLGAETEGAKVWISPGKHASYLSERMCAGGCGADRCEHMEPLKTTRIINLGEVGRPMHGNSFAESPEWPLRAKMLASNFPQTVLSRVQALPDGAVALYHPGRHPAQGVIARSATTGGAIAGSGEDTGAALSMAGDHTTDALATAGGNTSGAIALAGGKTGNAVGRSLRQTRHALGISAHHVGKALGVAPADQAPRAEPTPN